MKKKCPQITQIVTDYLKEICLNLCNLCNLWSKKNRSEK